MRPPSGATSPKRHPRSSTSCLPKTERTHICNAKSSSRISRRRGGTTSSQLASVRSSDTIPNCLMSIISSKSDASLSPQELKPSLPTIFRWLEASMQLLQMRESDSTAQIHLFEREIFNMSIPPKPSQPKFISLEGNIGSGKSTVLKIIQENFPELTILDEPLVEWQKIGENKDVNLLQMYYSDTQRWGFTFQIYAFMTRLKKWAEFSKEHGDGFRISERSLLSDRYIFASLMRDMSILSEAEYAVYERCYDSLTKINKVVDLCGLIYIRCPPETCSARILKRSREGEGNIPEEYIQKLHEKHQDWMSRNERVLTIDNSTPLDKNKIIDAVRDWLEDWKSN